MRMRQGVLGTMARAELAALVEDLAREYRSGAAARVAAADPRWRDDLDAAERGVGALLETFREADAALAAWPPALARLARAWARVLDDPCDIVSPDDGDDRLPAESDPVVACEVA